MDDKQFEIMHELLAAIYVQVSRQYDMLAIIADKQGADAIGLSKEHEKGKVLGPPPMLLQEEE
jgi:hypothetical protein